MKSFGCIAAIAVLAIVAREANSACLCSFGEGRDMCSGPKCAPMVIRPAKLPKLNLEDISKPRVVCKQVGGLPALKPIGDLCSCKQSIVVPAFVPKPVCASCKKQSCGCGASSSGASSSSSSYGGGSSYSGSSSYSGASSFNGGSSYAGGSAASYSAPAYAPQQEEIVYTAAADPVSLSLAYKAQQKACSTSEDKLAFGFRRLPIDGSKAKIVKNVPEELLYKLNGEIVELKPVSCNKGISVDEEAMEQLAAEEYADEIDTQEFGGGSVKQLSYGEIGFGKANVAAVPFVAVEGVVQANPQPIQMQGGSSNCNDGFVPGNVIMKNTPQREIYVPGPRVPLDCDSGEDMPMRFVSSYSSSSSSSASSANSANHQYSYGCSN
ncbi:PREDICTED: uncharacterized protein LOC108568491 [Nicrophorus vespilloides]|uniref:Uncharacterized protein LOC108568491 n=1 Tax=Nicrophorus vespilloides TaxID=110193 RepID=A0ABM1NE51_NICVS|nr:PREDICTED: uncharacterized protein LOC108568491 [Nicrophorus vespilloides]